MTKPSYLRQCSPNARLFPNDWKVAYFRLNRDKEGYICPICKRVFEPIQIEELHGDHIKPVVQGGLTIWENLQLLCSSCNFLKGGS